MTRPQPAETTVKMAARMYRMGYRQGMTELYADNDPANLAYGLKYYGRQGEMKYGEYERGIADALADRMNSDDEHPGCLTCGRNEWGHGQDGAYCHRHAGEE